MEILKMLTRVKTMSKKVFRCECGEEVDVCDWCGKKFRVGDKIICLEEQHHFCSEKCLNKYIDDTGIIAEARVILSDEDDD